VIVVAVSNGHEGGQIVNHIFSSYTKFVSQKLKRKQQTEKLSSVFFKGET
jgi:hypothetical protein